MRAPSLSTVLALTFVIGVPIAFLTGPDRSSRPIVSAASPSATRAASEPAGASAAQAGPAATAAPAWQVPDPDSLPADSFGRTVRYGRDLIMRTSSTIGPDARDPAMRFAGNGLDCQSCHLQAGTRQFGLPLAGIWRYYPAYAGRDGAVDTLQDRVNGCMERSMNGRALPVDGPEMTAIMAYIRFLSGPDSDAQPVPGRGSPPLPLMSRAADPARGQRLYAQICAACHGVDGQGERLDPVPAAEAGRRYRFPPLWGPDSYNDGAGMARTITAARFVHANMPFGIDFRSPALSAEDAFDVMAFVNSQPRPRMAGLENDYPDRLLKPVDAAYPPFVGPFPPEQHRFGPWGPIEAWLRANHPPAPTPATPAAR